MNKFDKLYNKIISEANKVGTVKPKLNLDDLATKLSKEFGLGCETLTGKNTKGSPLEGSFCGKAYGDGYSINILVKNGKVSVNLDGSSDIIFYNKTIYNYWLNIVTEAAKKFQIKFADFYISKD